MPKATPPACLGQRQEPKRGGGDPWAQFLTPNCSSSCLRRRRAIFISIPKVNLSARLLRQPVVRVGAELRDGLETAELNIRMFLAIKAVLDAAADAVGLDVPRDESLLAGPNTRLDAFVHLYNIRLEELTEERKSGATRLEKALKMLPAIDADRLKPSPESLKQLKDKILHDARGQEWLRTKAESLVCGDGISFRELLN
jgi:hypothetical protein